MRQKGCVILFLVLAPVLSLGIVLRLVQQQQEAEAQTAYYTAILKQAPCIANVCPGFEGRARVIERLSNAENLERIVDNGGAPVSFSFTSSEVKVSGGGAVIFTLDTFDNYDFVSRLYLNIPNLKLETVLDALGEPDKFLFISGCGEGLRVHAKLFYVSRGVEIMVDYSTRRLMSQRLRGDTSVSSIEYFSPADFQGHILQSLKKGITDSVAYDLDPALTEDDFIAEIQPWPGLDASPTPSANFCPR